MAETYGLLEIPEENECPECGTELEPIIMYGDLRAGCPECIPDGLFDSYSLEAAIERSL